MDETKVYDTDEFVDENISETLKEIVLNLEERGYNPINQIVGYLMSGDPGYISNHKESRNKILKFDRTKIIEVLLKIKNRSCDEFNNLVKNIYLFDLDKTAIIICKARIAVLFGLNIDSINDVCGDFLSKSVKVPKDCCIISNPPYSQIKDIKGSWEYKTAISESKDLYVGFIEKMIRTSKKAVVVSPQSYIVGSKFKKLRNILPLNKVPGTLSKE